MLTSKLKNLAQVSVTLPWNVVSLNFLILFLQCMVVLGGQGLEASLSKALNLELLLLVKQGCCHQCVTVCDAFIHLSKWFCLSLSPKTSLIKSGGAVLLVGVHSSLRSGRHKQGFPLVRMSPAMSRFTRWFLLHTSWRLIRPNHEVFVFFTSVVHHSCFLWSFCATQLTGSLFLTGFVIYIFFVPSLYVAGIA